MKKIYALLATALLTVSVFLPQQAGAQSPEKMSYQAVIRDGSNNLVTSTTVGMQISILQGTTSGTAVYVETQTPTSNNNGLVSIEIGAGTVVSGNFATIDWANGPYFIKTETDPTGETTYTITGTSQLLSVPYALHAKTAESISGVIPETDPVFGTSLANDITAADTTYWNNKLDSYTETDPTFTSSLAANITATDITNLDNLSGVNTGDQDLSALATKTALGDSTAQVRSEIPDVSGFLTSYTEADPTYTSSQAANITATDITNLGNLSGVNTGDQDGSETKVTAGTNVTVTGSGTTASPYVVNATTLTIGQSYQGGIIFWLDATGQHGLIAATADQSTGIKWYNDTFRYTGTTGDGLYAGSMNTAMIVATQMADNETGNFAAKICAEYSVTVDGVTYGDWYLPSKYELNLLYLQKTAVGGFANALYWSSTEEYNYNYGAWIQFFDGGYQDTYLKDDPDHVRAIRAF